MERREFIKCLGMGAGALAVGGYAVPFARAQREVAVAANGKRPNILVHLADDMSWAHMGIAGDPLVKTPHIDRLAEQGVYFHNAFVSSATCTASRASLLTGRHAHELEDGANLIGSMPESIAVYTTLLHNAGYHVGKTRKGYGPGDAAGWRDWNRDPAGPMFQSFDAFLQARPDDKPFLFWYGSTQPHRPFRAGSGARAGIDVNKVNVLPYWPDAPDVRNDLADYLLQVQAFDSQLGELYKSLEAAGELENTVIIVLSDNGMPFPRCKASLYDYGTRVPAIISWPGTFAGARRIDDMLSYIDIAPTICELAGLKPHPEMTGKSILPILNGNKQGIVDETRREVILGTEGFGRDRLWPTRGIRTHDYLYIRNFAPERWPVLGTLQGGPTKAYMDANKNDPEVAKINALSFGQRPAVELYDVKQDTYQIHNLADKAESRQTLRDLDIRLTRVLQATKDPRLQGRQPGR